MSSTTKIAFIEIGNCNDDIMKLCHTLKYIFGIECSLGKYFNKKSIYVDKKNYLTAIIFGNLIANYYSYDVKWVNKFGKARGINNFCFCRLYAKGLYEDTSIEVKKIVNMISEEIKFTIADTKTISYTYNKFTNDYGIHIKLYDILDWMYDDIINNSYDKMVIVERECDISMKFYYMINAVKRGIDKYLYNNDYEKYFKSVEALYFDESVVTTQGQDELLRRKRLSEYFYNSSIYKGIISPEGSNLSAKVSNKDIDTTYYVSSKRYCTTNLESNIENANAIPAAYKSNGDSYSHLGNVPNFVIDSSKISIISDFITEYEEYARSSFTEFYYPEEKDVKFLFSDTINVKTDIQNVNENTVKVISIVNVKRNIKGEKVANTPTVYDALLKSSNYKDCEFSFTCIDYYEIIDLNILLHYTDNSKFYETFEIPIGFKIEDGLSSIKNTSVIYDDTHNEWIDYNDISEVKNILIN